MTHGGFEPPTFRADTPDALSTGANESFVQKDGLEPPFSPDREACKGVHKPLCYLCKFESLRTRATPYSLSSHYPDGANHPVLLCSTSIGYLPHGRHYTWLRFILSLGVEDSELFDLSVTACLASS